MDGLLIAPADYPEMVCPLCGNNLFEFRQQLRCSNRGCVWLESCCEGATCDYDDKEGVSSVS